MTDTDNDIEALFRAIGNVAVESPELQQLGFSAEEFAEPDFLSMLCEPPRAYRLQTLAVLLYLAELPRKETTTTQWLVGRELANQLFKGMIKDRKKRGRPNEMLDRFYVCAFIEWAITTKEIGETEAIRLAANVFQKPTFDTLHRWFKGQTGYASKEKRASKLAIEMFENLPDILDALPLERIPRELTTPLQPDR